MALLDCKTEQGNNQRKLRQPMIQTKGLFCTCQPAMGSVSITTTVSLLANEFGI